jgi:hypothetical protein
MIMTPISEYDDLRKYEIRNISYHPDSLTVDLQGEVFQFFKFTFEDVSGFRVLDEKEYSEYWDHPNYENHLIYEISPSGWFSEDQYEDMREFLICSSICVNVLAADIPSIHHMGRQ